MSFKKHSLSFVNYKLLLYIHIIVCSNNMDFELFHNSGCLSISWVGFVIGCLYVTMVCDLGVTEGGENLGFPPFLPRIPPLKEIAHCKNINYTRNVLCKHKWHAS